MSCSNLQDTITLQTRIKVQLNSLVIFIATKQHTMLHLLCTASST